VLCRSHIVHRIGIDVLAHGDGEPHALRAGQGGGEEVALPALVDLMALLHLDDAAAPIGHAVRDHHVLDDARLQAGASTLNSGLAHRWRATASAESVHAAIAAHSTVL